VRPHRRRPGPDHRSAHPGRLRGGGRLPTLMARVGAFAAVDLGATSGRVIRAEVSAEGAQLQEVHRFVNEPIRDGGALRWQVSSLWQEVLSGLRAAGEQGGLDGIGIDSWAVDYGLLDAHGQRPAALAACRYARAAAGLEQGPARISPDDLYAISGMQHLPFNTIDQLAAEQRGPLWDRAARALLLPDLLGYWLTGVQVSELTNASTTALLDQRTRT